MPYFIGSACADTTDRSCVEVCPVDCIYEGDRKLYIHPAECIDCGACETECPVEAIGSTLNLEDGDADQLADNAAFFETVLPGRSEPIGSPGGAQDIGRVGVDTPLAAALPAQDS